MTHTRGAKLPQGAESETRIEIKGLQLWGQHGVLAEEKIRPQAFEVDVVFSVPAAAADDVAHTVDYRQVIDTVHQLNQSHSFQLIESFANEIARRLLIRFDPIHEVCVRVKKHPPFPAGIHLQHVSAEVHQRRNGSPPTSV